MSPYFKASLTSLIFSIVGVYCVVTDRSIQGFIAILAACVFLAASFIIQAVEVKK